MTEICALCKTWIADHSLAMTITVEGRPCKVCGDCIFEKMEEMREGRE